MRLTQEYQIKKSQEQHLVVRKPNPPNSSLTYLGRAAHVLLSQSAARNPKAGRTLGERSTFPAG